MSKSPRILWSDKELSSAVDAYVFLLQAQQIDVQRLTDRDVQRLVSSHLNARNEASIRYRMRNISAVVIELGLPAVRLYSAADSVGKNVRTRLRAILAENNAFQEMLRGARAEGASTAAVPNSRSHALELLADLKEKLLEIERDYIGVGHNRPPEPIEDTGFPGAAFEQARRDITDLETQLNDETTDISVAEERVNRLLAFGLKASLWTGARITKFTDAALAVLAPIAVAYATGLTPLLLDALRAAVRVISH